MALMCLSFSLSYWFLLRQPFQSISRSSPQLLCSLNLACLATGWAQKWQLDLSGKLTRSQYLGELAQWAGLVGEGSCSARKPMQKRRQTKERGGKHSAILADKHVCCCKEIADMLDPQAHAGWGHSLHKRKQWKWNENYKKMLTARHVFVNNGKSDRHIPYRIIARKACSRTHCYLYIYEMLPRFRRLTSHGSKTKS